MSFPCSARPEDARASACGALTLRAAIRRSRQPAAPNN